MTEINAQNIHENSNSDCSPLNSLYCTLKMKITGKLNDKNLNKLYQCTLCNQCKTASFNQSTREKAVCKSLILPHVANISKNISKFGNSYGIDPASNEKEQEIMETVLFRGCTPTYKTPDILHSAENVLKHKGIDYGTINSETCCGNILFNLGDYEASFKAVRKNIDKFEASGVKRIITICPGCYNAFNKYYKGYNGFKPEIILAVDLLNESTILGEDLIIQDPCHAKQKANNVRKIIRESKNKSASPCCGAGAGVMAHDRQLATVKARRTLDNPQKIVTYCPFCYINLSSVKPNKTIDIYMLLDEQIEFQEID